MLATLPASEPSLDDPRMVYEPKYDGIRAIALVDPPRPAASSVRRRGEPRPGDAPARFWSRLGNEKTAQFPELVEALGEWGRALTGPVVLDGEIVALDAKGNPAGFQRLQNRIHVTVPGYRSSKPILRPDEQPAAFIAFDLLREGDDDLRAKTLTERRARLEALFARHPLPASKAIRVSEQVVGDGRALYQRARREGWEGLLVKQARSAYRDGRRSPEWLKLKILRQDEFVVGGWTEPKGTRTRFGSLILGHYDAAGDLVHAGDVGTGFNGAELDRVWKLLAPLETTTSPFREKPKTLGRPHWATPKLVAQVRYTEVTDDGRLRHPVYLGLRDDKTARDARCTKDTKVTKGVKGAEAIEPRRARGPNPLAAWTEHADALTAQLDDFEKRKKDGKLRLPGGDTLDVTNLHKVFWPGPPYTKGDLLRYYARMAPVLLPVIENRPLVMKRFPNGVQGDAFYQHRAPDVYPRGVRVEEVHGADVPTMFVGGALKTLLYMAQLAAISMDPWFSTTNALDEADQVAIDLDPQPGATFTQILDVARWVRDELERLDVPAYPKTSGAEGLHVFIPLPAGTPYETGVLLCQIIATIVATKHPKVATIERMVKRRKDGTIYVDYLQNIPGKTLACAYSARASAFAGVSTPLTWEEIDDNDLAAGLHDQNHRGSGEEDRRSLGGPP